MSHDKQLSGFNLREMRQKQRLDQALTTKEFAILAGVSYAVARQWLRMLGFPALSGLVFWQDFVMWRRQRTGIEASPSIRSTLPMVPFARPQNGIFKRQNSPKPGPLAGVNCAHPADSQLSDGLGR